MATIVLDDHFKKDERIILTKTFRQNCRDLKIDKHDFVAHIRRVDLGSCSRYARVAHPEPAFFAVEMNDRGFNLFDATSSLGHELIHVRQHLYGHMRNTFDPDGVIWKGKFWPAEKCMDRSIYEDLPWEKEAFGAQGMLHLRALRKLHDDGLFGQIKPEDSNGLAEFTFREMDALKRRAPITV